MKQYIIGALIGAVVIFVILKVIAKKPKVDSESKTMENILNVAKTDEARNLISSAEFTAVMKTPAFKKFATEFGMEQLVNFIQV